MVVSISNERWAIFDLDDTIGGVEIDGKVELNTVAYQVVLKQFAEYVSKDCGVDPSLILQRQEEIDRDLCNQHGFADAGRFSESLVLTFEHFHGSVIPTKIANELMSLGMSVFEFPYRLLPGAETAVSRVRQCGYRVAVVTKGAEAQQRKKLEAIPLKFDRAFVVPRKDDEDWANVLGELGITEDNAHRHWSIGNSVKSDINPALLAGLNAVHIQIENEWSFEKAVYIEPRPNAQLIMVRSIETCATFFKESILNAGSKFVLSA